MIIIIAIKSSNQINNMGSKLNLSAIFGASVIAITTSLTACNSTPEATQPIPKTLPLVIATNTVICGLTKQIAADTINLKCLIDSGSDPHVYEPTPDDRKAIASIGFRWAIGKKYGNTSYG